MIDSLRDAIRQAKDAGISEKEFPDGDGKTLLRKAIEALQQEKDSVKMSLEEAVRSGGALKLQRAVAQAQDAKVQDTSFLLAEAQNKLHQVGERKKGIALLKMAM